MKKIRLSWSLTTVLIGLTTYYPLLAADANSGRRVELHAPPKDSPVDAATAIWAGQPVEEDEHGSKVAEHALSLVASGEYVTEGKGFIVSNYPSSPTYLLNDFKVLFSNWSPVESPQHQLLQNEAKKNYLAKKLKMNCWQFVLLVLLETKMITKENIENLYYHKDMGRWDRWVHLWREHSHSGNPKIGDIALLSKEDKIIWHAAVVTSISPLKLTDMLNSPVSEKEYRAHSTESLLFLSPSIAAQAIRTLEKGDYSVGPKTPHFKAEEFKELCTGDILKPKIVEEIDRLYKEWRKENKGPAEMYLSPATVKLCKKYEKAAELERIFEEVLKQEFEEKHLKDIETCVMKNHGVE